MSEGQAVPPPVEECDVVDKAALAKFRALRAKWFGWIHADSNHSIWSQIFAMVSNDLAVHTISCAAENDPNSPLHNQLIARTILQAHQDAQILGIRRLLDPRRDVISLKRLLKDIESNLNLFTREIYVSGAGAPYDLSAVRGFWSTATHNRFDRLACVAAANRDRTDTLPRRLIDHLTDHIETTGAAEIVQWSNQFVAHAGDVRGPGWRDLNATFEAAASTQRSIVQVVHLITSQLLQGPSLGNLVPVEHNPFARFDRLVSPAALAAARQRRDELEADRNSWLHNSWGSVDLLTAIGWPNVHRSGAEDG